MKMTLLEIVQSILSDMDAEDVNSISDTTEATQVASIVRDTFFNMVTNRTIPEHKQLIKLTPLSSSAYPTHFQYDDNTKIESVWYKDGDTYETVRWLEPLDFLRHCDSRQSNYVEVADKKAGTTIRVGTDVAPSYYTSFDDEFIIMDSYDSSVDSTLQRSKVRAYGVVPPTFDMHTDGFVPDLDANLFPYFLAEAKSTAFSLLHGGPDPKVEQAARRQKYHLQNDKHNTVTTRKLSKYGR